VFFLTHTISFEIEFVVLCGKKIILINVHFTFIIIWSTGAFNDLTLSVGQWAPEK